MYLGDFPTGATIRCYFTTHTSIGGAATPLSAFENADCKIYKNGSATERSSVTGTTMTSPFDSISGLHLFEIDTSDNTDAGFFAAGNDYTVVLNPDTETVDGQTVVAVIARFSIDNRGLLRPTVASRTLDVSAGGEAGVDWANVGSPTTVLNLSGTSTKAVEPTTAGRTLDIAANGGIDADSWANMLATTVDGIALSVLIKNFLGFIGGKVTNTDNGDGTVTITYSNQAGATILTVIANKTTGARAAAAVPS
jgi:hypothetical protein